MIRSSLACSRGIVDVQTYILGTLKNLSVLEIQTSTISWRLHKLHQLRKIVEGWNMSWKLQNNYYLSITVSEIKNEPSILTFIPSLEDFQVLDFSWRNKERRKEERLE